MAETAPARTPRSANQRERRTKPRKSAEDLSLVTVEMGSAGFGLMLDVAEGGVGVQVMQRVEPGTGVQIAFKVPELSSQIQGTGVVTWCNEDDGRMGIRFEQLSAAGSQELRQWIDSLPEAPSDESDSSQLHPALQEQARTVQREIAESHLDVDLMLQYLVERVVELTSSNGGAIALGHGDIMVCRASSGLAPEVGATIGSGSALTSECLRTGRTVRCDDTEVDTRVNREICRELNLRSSLILPILFEHQVRGVVEVFSPAPYAFNERHQKLLQQLADFTAQVVYGPMPASAAEIQSSAKAKAKPEHTVLSALLAATTMGVSEKPKADAAPLDVVPAPKPSPPPPVALPKPQPAVIPAAASPSMSGAAAAQPARTKVEPEPAKPTLVKEPVAPTPPVIAKPTVVVKEPAPVKPEPAREPAIAKVAEPAIAKAAEPAKPAPKEAIAPPRPPEKSVVKEIAVVKEPSVPKPAPIVKEPPKPAPKEAVVVLEPRFDLKPEIAAEPLLAAGEAEAAATGFSAYRNVLIAVAVLIVVALGWFYFARTRSATPAPLASTPAVPQSQPAATPPASAASTTPAAHQASTSTVKPVPPAESNGVRSPNAAVKADDRMPLIIATGKRPPGRNDIPAEAPSIAAASPNLTAINLPSATSRPELQSQGVVTGGNLLKRVEPLYPDFAKLQRIQGDVVLTARITKDGTLDRIKRVKGNPVFEPAAIGAVRQWKYEPYKLNGLPQDVDITITLQFRLKQ